MSTAGPATERSARRAMALVPAALTVGNVFLGFFSVVQAFEGRHVLACACLVAAGVFDRFDGLIARRTGTESEFGRELDSLADVISFGVAPAVIAYTWGLHLVPKIGWGVAFLYLMCGSLRLARFNVQSASSDRRFFTGLPIPLAAGVPVTFILVVEQAGGGALARAEPVIQVTLLVLMVLAAFLMISRFRYFSFKEVRFERRRRNLVWLSLGLVAVALAAWPARVLFVTEMAYVSHGPLLRLLARRRGAAPLSDAQSELVSDVRDGA